MADNQRVYTDEEFARILRTAAELANRPDQPGPSSSGLTLSEMKSAAAQAGLDPALIERAARMTGARSTTSPFARIIGGPLRHEHEAHFPVRLDEQRAERLLSAVRIAAAHVPSVTGGHSSALGMAWQASSGGDVISVVARPDDDGTSVSIVVDRRGTFAIVGLVSAVAIGFALLAAVGFYHEYPALSPWFLPAGAVAALGLARRFWASSTRKVHERIGAFMDAVGRALE